MQIGNLLNPIASPMMSLGGVRDGPCKGLVRGATTGIGWYDFGKIVCLFYCYVYSVGCFPCQD